MTNEECVAFIRKAWLKKDFDPDKTVKDLVDKAYKYYTLHYTTLHYTTLHYTTRTVQYTVQKQYTVHIQDSTVQDRNNTTSVLGRTKMACDVCCVLCAGC